MNSIAQLQSHATAVASMLVEQKKLVVFAESCTAGLVSASLARTPGISQFLCGSMVVYQEVTKNRWLGIDEQILIRPGAVSSITARQMAERVLKMTPQADFAASVTGHLGPNAPAKLDGIVYIASSRRGRKADSMRTSIRRHRLRSNSRSARQREAAILVLLAVSDWLESTK